MNVDTSRRRQRVRRRRLRRLKNVSLVAIPVALITAVVWAAALTAPPEPAGTLPLPPVPTPVATAADPAMADPTAAATDPTVPLVRLAVLGDAGTREAMQTKVAAQVAAADRTGRPFDALLITGDLIYDDGDAELTDASVVRPYAATFTKPEIVAVLGNHDTESDEGSDIMRRLGRSGPIYVQDVGPVRVISLDSNDVDSRQTQWLSQVVAQTQTAKTWIIAMMHHPAFSSGEHGPEKAVREKWVPLFARYGVDLVLSGHDHNYERTKPQSGVTYVVSGGGGAEVRDVGRSSFTAASASKHHFVDLNVFADRIQGRAIDSNGAVIDSFTIPMR